MGGDLPEDLVINILLRLPIICFIRFRCVCKTWYVLLSNPNFIYKKLISNYDDANKDSYLLFKRHDSITKDHVFSLYSYDTLEIISATLSIPPYINELDEKIKIYVVGSCNGLVCLENDQFHRIVLWNPVTSETKILPKPHYLHPFYYEKGIFFVFDTKVDDYKIIRIVEINCGCLDYYCNHEPQDNIIEVYSLRSDSWRKVDLTLPSRIVIKDNDNQYHANGIYWWAVFNNDDGETILSYDSTQEVFKETSLPDISTIGKWGYSCWRTYLQLNEHVAMINVIAHEERAPYSFDIWVLFHLGVTESWTKLFSTAPILQVQDPERIPNALVLWKNGKLLLQTCIGEVIILDPTTEEICNSQINGESGTLQIVTYVKSQIQLEGTKELQHRIHELSI